MAELHVCRKYDIKYDDATLKAHPELLKGMFITLCEDVYNEDISDYGYSLEIPADNYFNMLDNLRSESELLNHYALMLEIEPDRLLSILEHFYKVYDKKNDFLRFDWF